MIHKKAEIGKINFYKLFRVNTVANELIMEGQRSEMHATAADLPNPPE